MATQLDNIGAIIGWKHNNQEGMSTVDGIITEFPDGIPSDADIATWKTEYGLSYNRRSVGCIMERWR